jgi:hypothetical protein
MRSCAGSRAAMLAAGRCSRSTVSGRSSPATCSSSGRRCASAAPSRSRVWRARPGRPGVGRDTQPRQARQGRLGAPALGAHRGRGARALWRNRPTFSTTQCGEPDSLTSHGRVRVRARFVRLAVSRGSKRATPSRGRGRMHPSSSGFTSRYAARVRSTSRSAQRRAEARGTRNVLWPSSAL